MSSIEIDFLFLKWLLLSLKGRLFATGNYFRSHSSMEHSATYMLILSLEYRLIELLYAHYQQTLKVLYTWMLAHTHIHKNFKYIVCSISFLLKLLFITFFFRLWITVLHSSKEHGYVYIAISATVFDVAPRNLRTNIFLYKD